MPPADSLKEDPLFDEFDKEEKENKKGKKTRKKKEKENKPVQSKGGDPPMTILKRKAGLVEKVEEMIDNEQMLTSRYQMGLLLMVAT